MIWMVGWFYLMLLIQFVFVGYAVIGGWLGWVSFLFCGLVLAVFAGCMFVLDAVVASYSLLQWYLCFGVLLVVVGLGIWVCVFVGCFSRLDLMICGGPGFLFWV